MYARPFLLEYRSANWFVVLCVSTAVFTDMFVYGILVPTVPFALGTRVGVPEDQRQKWVSILLAVYSAFLLASSPISGYFADRTETRRQPLLVALLFMGGSTVMLMLGRSLGVLIAARALQGISGAAVWSIGLALLVDTIGSQEIGEAMGYVSLSMSLAIFCAPLLGGIVYQRSGYYAVFYMAFGVIALDIVLRLLIIEKPEAQKWAQHPATSYSNHDLVQCGRTETERARPEENETCHETLDTPRLTKERNDPIGTYRTTPPTADGLWASVCQREETTHEVFNSAEHKSIRIFRRRCNTPAALSLLASPRLCAALWGCLVLATIMTSFDAVLPLRVEHLFGWDSVGAGLVFLAIVVPSLTNPLIGKIADRYGARLLTTAGFIINVPLLVCLRYVDRDTLSQKVLLCALLAMLGLALSSALIPLFAEITYSVEQSVRNNPKAFGRKGAFAQGYGLMNAAYAGGTLVGPIWSGFVNDTAGWTTMAWTLALFDGVSAIIMFLFLDGWIRTRGLRSMIERRRNANTDTTP